MSNPSTNSGGPNVSNTYSLLVISAVIIGAPTAAISDDPTVGTDCAFAAIALTIPRTAAPTEPINTFACKESLFISIEIWLLYFTSGPPDTTFSPASVRLVMGVALGAMWGFCFTVFAHDLIVCRTSLGNQISRHKERGLFPYPPAAFRNFASRIPGAPPLRLTPPAIRFEWRLLDFGDIRLEK